MPDWLRVVDRKARVRAETARSFISAPDSITSEIALGIVQHLNDDLDFHSRPAFSAACSEITALINAKYTGQRKLRSAFLGHLLLELLLDAALAIEYPGYLREYFRVLETIDANEIERSVNLIIPEYGVNLTSFIASFREKKIIRDYLDDVSLVLRINQVLRRAGLEELSRNFVEILPCARSIVTGKRHELLSFRGLEGRISVEEAGAGLQSDEPMRRQFLSSLVSEGPAT